ncbi:MAG: hypothetical protein AB7L84_09960 [Acidimicrobiia bacterium]
MRPFKRRKVAGLAAGAVLATTVGVLAPLAPAGAATAETPNACRYSYDGIWRDVDVTFTGASTPNPVAAGSTITLSGATVTAEIPAELIAYAYNDLGMLSLGENSFPVSVWLALTATNTDSPTKVVELTANATTTISGAAPNATATPLTFTAAIPATTWTATGGTVSISQAAQGTLGTLPNAGINDAPVSPTGSAYIKTRIGDTGPQLRLDCLSGRQVQIPGNPVTYSYEALPAPAFDTVTVEGGGGDPDPEPGETAFECQSNLGAYQGAEIIPFDLTLATSQAPQVAGGQVTLRSLTANGSLAGSFIADLYGRGQAPLGEATHNATFYVAVQGANTVEGVQVVTGNFTWTSNVTDPTPGDVWGADPSKPRTDLTDPNDATATDVSFTVALANSTWTPAGPGDVDFTLAPAGSLPRLTIVGHGYGGFYPTFPYGSVFLRSETGHYGSNFDCVNGTIAINEGTACNANQGVLTNCIPPRSLYGNIPFDPAIPDPVDPNATAPIRGSIGRYTITEGDPIELATASVSGDAPIAKVNQVTTFNVIGSPLRLTQANSVFPLSSVAPGGTATGSLADLTVTDLRGTNAGWTLSGQFSDFGNATDSISASNAGWTPTASVLSVPVGDSQVTPGAAITSGLDTPQTLCSSPAGHSGGEFRCDASVRLTVPASTAKGTYTGLVTITLV